MAVPPRRPRKRSCDSMTDSSSCARSSPARPRLGLFVRSLSIRRSAAATRSRARSKSAMVYCRGFGRVRFLRGPFALLARMAALSRFPVAVGPLRFSRPIPPIKHIRRGVASRVALILGVHGTFAVGFHVRELYYSPSSRLSIVPGACPLRAVRIWVPTRVTGHFVEFAKMTIPDLAPCTKPI